MTCAISKEGGNTSMQATELRVFECGGIGGIARSKGFEEKGPATYGADVAYKCPYDCAYCSSAAMCRHRQVIREFGVSPFGRGRAIVDLAVPERLDARVLARLRTSAMAQVCTASDAWALHMGDVGLLDGLHVLLYPANVTSDDRGNLDNGSGAIIWLQAGMAEAPATLRRAQRRGCLLGSRSDSADESTGSLDA